MEAIEKFFVENDEIKDVNEWQEYSGDTYIYEVIKIMDSKPLFYEEHYNRLKNSCDLAETVLNISIEKLQELISKLVHSNNKVHGNIKIIYGVKNKKIRIFFIKHSYPTKEMYDEGVNTFLYFGERCNPNAKIINSSFKDKVNKEIKERNAFEAILVDHNNLITEGSRSNIFFIKDGCLITSKVEQILPGVTRTEIINMAKENKIGVIEKSIKVEELKKYDAIFISGTSPDILPIRKVGDIEFNVKDEMLIKLMFMFKERISMYLQ